MHTWQTLGFLCAAAACIVASVERSWAVALLGASLALALVPTVFNAAA
jgi:hypothetical protein